MCCIESSALAPLSLSHYISFSLSDFEPTSPPPSPSHDTAQFNIHFVFSDGVVTKKAMGRLLVVVMHVTFCCNIQL